MLGFPNTQFVVMAKLPQLSMLQKAADAELEALVLQTAASIKSDATAKVISISEQVMARTFIHLEKGLRDFSLRQKDLFAQCKNKKNKLEELDEFAANLRRDLERLHDLIHFLEQCRLGKMTGAFESIFVFLKEVLQQLDELSGISALLRDDVRYQYILLNSIIALNLKDILSDEEVRDYFDIALDEIEKLSSSSKKSSQTILCVSIIFKTLIDWEMAKGDSNVAWTANILEIACRWVPTMQKLKELNDQNLKMRHLYNGYIIMSNMMTASAEKSQDTRATESENKQAQILIANVRQKITHIEGLHYAAMREILKKSNIDYALVEKKDGLSIKFELQALGRVLYGKLINKIQIILEECSCKLIIAENKIMLQPLLNLPLLFLNRILNAIAKAQRLKEEYDIQQENRLQYEQLSLKRLAIASSPMPPLSNAPMSVRDKPFEFHNEKKPSANLEQDPKKSRLPKVLKLKREKNLSETLRLGFSEEIFGASAIFKPCRSRGGRLKPIYVVDGGNRSDESPTKEEMEDFRRRFDNAKIVPSEGEIGFKFEARKGSTQTGQGAPILYCKTTSNWRYYPTHLEVTSEGKMAYKFGHYHNTKKGKFDKDVRLHGFGIVKKSPK